MALHGLNLGFFVKESGGILKIRSSDILGFHLRFYSIDHSAVAARGVVALWSTFFSVFRFQVDVRLRENLISDKPCVLVCNHQSSLDVISMMDVLPDRCTVLAKRELLYFGPFGFAAWLSGLVFVDRLNREKARNTMDMIAKLMHDQKLKLWVFPEGTRSHQEDGMLPFKKGAFNLAVSAQVPIVPVVFSSYRNFFSGSRKIFNRGKVIVECLPSVPTEGLKADDVTELTETVRNKMLEAFTRISAEYEPLSSRESKDK
ncbi:1-acyl-sn-glycerol-3-phosphate acyltransferase alpha [Lamellibrachia satsuma]|nr:1-acyl-sn-glycerol-3-phosphate acyltransferase alpha [Lamellibrachia satsuma]